MTHNFLSGGVRFSSCTRSWPEYLAEVQRRKLLSRNRHQFPGVFRSERKLQRLFISEALYYQQSNSVTWKHGDCHKKMSHPSHIDTIPQRLSDLRLEEAFSAHGQSGHRFVRKTFTRPSYCHHCTDLLWGLTNQGLICEGREHKDTVPCFVSTRRWLVVFAVIGYTTKSA